MKTTQTEIQELEIVLEQTGALAPTDNARNELIAELKPIAERLPELIQYADQLTVSTQAEAEAAATNRELITQTAEKAEALIRDFNGGLVERLFRLHRGWTANLNRFKNPLDAAAKIVKQKIIQFHEGEKEKALAIQAKLQAEADEKARKERERLEKEASKIKTPELKEQRLAEAAQVVAPVVQVQIEKSPVKTQTRWTVESVDKFALAAAAVRDRNNLGYLDVNTTALTRAKAANSMLEVPGVVFKKVMV